MRLETTIVKAWGQDLLVRPSGVAIAIAIDLFGAFGVLTQRAQDCLVWVA